MFEEKNASETRNLPVYVICHNTRHRIINQVIYEEFIFGLLLKTSNWEEKAVKRLSNFGINLSSITLKMYQGLLKTGKRDPASIANFSSMFENEELYTSRYGKDGMYKQLHMMISLWLRNGERKYVGLPANQILSINKEFGYENVVACERDKVMSEFMFCLQRHFSPSGNHATLINDDIFNYLSKTDKKFSIYDFDLMCCIDSNNILNKLIDNISKTSMDKCVVNIATTIGRKISESTYRSIMPGQFIEKISKTMNVVGHHSDGYNDRVIPMRYELFMLERKQDEPELCKDGN